MCRRKWLLKLLVILCTGLLSACNPLLLNNDYDAATNHNAQANADVDDAATSDYYNSNNANMSNSRDNLWVAIRENFKMDHYEDNPEVQAQIAWFMHNQGYLDRTARRAAPFMYYIYNQVQARNLPSELVLLPIIESAYNPFVSSSAGAAGLWQLVPGTARTFGVHEDFWYDGRRDITASTNAALDYLSYLQNFFGGNWLLAIAAYDTGEGNVEAAIRRNVHDGKDTDFWSLPLASETESYVPRLLALAAIIDNPKKYGIALPPISDSPYLGQVEISSQISLAQAAALANMSLDELKTLNPGYRRNTLDPNEPYKLLLPIDKVALFKEHLLHEATNVNGLWGRYKVQAGDSWRHIAKRFNTSIGLLQQVNHTTSATPPVGQILLIPENQNNEIAIATATTSQAADDTTTTDTTADTATTTATDDDTTATSDDQTDQSDTDTDTNDTDDTIAEPDISDAANLDADAIKQLDKENATTSTSPTSQGLHLYKIIHTVKSGETITSIANSHHVSAVELAHWNHLSVHSKLHHGMKLTIWRRMSANHTASKATQHTTNNTAYIVRNGDTLATIAKRHHVTVAQLEKWNKLHHTSALHPGQHLVIYTAE